MTLYEEMRAAGIPTDNHASDLYFPASDKAREILKRYPIQASTATGFVSNVDGKPWIEVPFAFDPYWNARV